MMPKASWDRLTVMIIEDNRFMASLMEQTLRSLGIHNVIIEEDGASAIRHLKQSALDPLGAGFSVADIIICDYLMPTVDGLLFLRWVRTGDGAPDRFVPVIMVSGAADLDVVREARDAGVTEFLAKPFSVASVVERLLQLVNRQRQFVLAQGYFGPDRRRAEHPVAKERRADHLDDVEIVKFESDKKTLRSDVRAILFRPPNRLREKVGFTRRQAEIVFDPELIAQAEARIKALAGDYSDWVRDSIRAMAKAHSHMVPDSEDDDQRLANRRCLAQVTRIAHELRGQGGIFDYPLVTALGKSLFETTKDGAKPVTSNRHTLIGAHIDGIRTVFNSRINGHGGDVGQALLHDIAMAVKRYA